MKRVLVGGLHHESNSFNPIVAGEKDFTVFHGEEIFENIRDNDSASGIITTLQEAGCEVVPTVFARAVPNGEVDREFYLSLKKEILDRAIAAHKEKPLDAITLSLHGSMRIKDFGEAEGPLLEELRAAFPDLPIYSALDMHTTMTQKMHDNCDGFVGYKFAPHTDCTETGIHAAEMTLKKLQEGIDGTSSWVRVPILIAGEQSATSTQPMITLIQALREVEKRQGVMAASYLMGFPWADSSDGTVSVHVVTEGDQNLADDTAKELAELIWNKREEFTFITEALAPKDALEKAIKSSQSGIKPFYISDSGDNPTAGASSDNTEFLKVILECKEMKKLKKPMIYGGFYDPLATKACAGKVGETVELEIGASFDTLSSTPVKVTGTVIAYYPGWTKNKYPKGDLAVVRTHNVDIILAEQHVGFTDPVMYSDLGLQPEDADIIVCKLGYLTPGHEKLAAGSVLALTVGNTNEKLENIDYQQVRRPVFPLDREFAYDVEDNLMHKGSAL